MSKFLDSVGLKHLWQKIKAAIPTKVSQLDNDSQYITLAQVPEGAAASETAPKMDGVANAGSENAFARGDHVHPSDDTKVDKVEGKGLSANDYTDAEKAKLEGIAEGANKYEHPTHTAKESGLYKVTVDGLGHVTAAAAVEKGDITGLGIPAQDTTYEVVTTETDGLMSKGDKSKLDKFGDADTYALKEDITAVYRVKGSVESYDQLPSTGNKKGDVYNVQKGTGEGEVDGMNYVWDGAKWDALGTITVYEALSNDEIDAAIAEAEA